MADFSFGQPGGQVFPGYANVLQHLISWVTATGGGTAPPGAIGGGGAPVQSSYGTLNQIPGTPPLLPPLPPQPTPGFPGGGSMPGVPGRGPYSIPDAVPGRVTGALGAFLRSWWIGALFYPSANPGGRGSQLCIETNYGPWCPPGLPTIDASVAAPAAVPGRRDRRRPRVVPAAPGRRRRRAVTVPGAAAPPQARPRGRPVTISRPRIETRPDVAAVVRTPPQPSSPPIPASLPRAQTVSLPRTVVSPAPVSIPASSSSSSLLPTLASVLLPSIGAWVGSIPGTVPRILSPTMPGQLPMPGLGATPGLNPQLNPLTQFNTAPAPSAAQDLDEQCRARARQRRKKRKPRSECWKGSYTETRKGTLKRRREKIKCQ